MSKDRSEYKDGTKIPIVRAGYLHGVDVVNIGDIRVSRGKSRIGYSSCGHRKMVYSSVERAVWCDDCETRIDPFEAFEILVKRSDHLENRIAYFKKVEQETLISRASKEFDKCFRSRSMAPCCPNCNEAIFPEDVVKGLSSVSKEWATQARMFKNKGGGQ